MAAFAHRTAPGFQNTRRYNLRGINNGPVILQKIARQRVKDAAAKSVNKNWRITRNSRRSRGLNRSGMTCFRLSGMQSLLYLPKFFNWILSHNNTKPNGTVVFPCAPVHTIGPALINKLSGPWNRLNLTVCPACVVKDFVQAYWGDYHLAANGEPQALAHTEAHMTALRRLDQQLYVLTLGAAVDAQQDPTEFLYRLLEACLASTDHTIPANAEWQTRFDALFIIEWNMTWTCACGANQPIPFGTTIDSIGIPTLPIEPPSTDDSVSAAIRRNLTPVTIAGDCATCNLRQQRTETKMIEGAPELLKISLAIARAVEDEEGNVSHIKNTNPIVLDRVLDLRNYQAVPDHPAPLKYHLKSVQCHGGAITGGHWTATVVDPQQVNLVNNGSVQARTRGYLNSNPQDGRQVMALWYAKVQTREL